jgi:rhamnose transport system ATP-binding protein
MSITANVSLASLDAVSRNGLIDEQAERDLAQRSVDPLRIKTPSVDSTADSLSGGNQQKVALARWLATGPTVLILDEPTQGVDVGSKAEIHKLMVDLAERGLAIVMISSELPEVLGMADRIVVLFEGRVSRSFTRAEADEHAIMRAATGLAEEEAA